MRATGRLAGRRHTGILNERKTHLSLGLYLDNTPSVIIVYVGKFGSSNAPSNHI